MQKELGAVLGECNQKVDEKIKVARNHNQGLLLRVAAGRWVCVGKVLRVSHNI